ncbi:enolase C-terminal domain-like protein, partial [Phenylobacterium sp.]|uniref:enolase C-terminal domain-like protein n=1 Tax=Phenylobacterium sp. TaxID=1871053 RepID=UPI00286DFF10
RVMFKQLLQADAIDVVQLDNCRLGGLNEAIAVMLLAAKFGKPICPHAGGVGLCEYAQHVSMIDYACISGQLEGRMTEHAGHLHEHFVDPICIARGRYLAPTTPGFSAEMHAASRRDYRFAGSTGGK